MASLHFAPSVYFNEFCFHVGASSFSPRWPNQLNRKTLATALETHWGCEAWTSLDQSGLSGPGVPSKRSKRSKQSRMEKVIFTIQTSISSAWTQMDSMYCGSMWISSLGIVVCSRMFKGTHGFVWVKHFVGF